MDDDSKESLKGISLLMALGAAQRAGTVSSLLYQARDICQRADDPAYLPLREGIDKLLSQIPGASTRLARALGVEPANYDYYDGNDHLRALIEFRKERGLPVTENEEGPPFDPPPFENPADLYALLCSPSDTSEEGP